MLFCKEASVVRKRVFFGGGGWGAGNSTQRFSEISQ